MQGDAGGEGYMTERVLFVSDPLCSWCWGMASEIEKARKALTQRVEFDLLLGGLGLNLTKPVTEAAQASFQSLWNRVHATTGQTFSGQFPKTGFVYNSTYACSAVLAFAQVINAPAFDYLHALQAEFFLHGQDINQVSTQIKVATKLGVDEQQFLRSLEQVREAGLASAFTDARGHGSSALPSVLFEEADGARHLVAGGYVTVEFLLPEIENWLAKQSQEKED